MERNNTFISENNIFTNERESESFIDKNLIEGMITFSTAHISEETSEYLIDLTGTWPDVNEDGDCPFSIYPKNLYGWFIHIDLSSDDYLEDCTVPTDLKELFCFAKANNCCWVGIDGDGLIIDSLKKYEW